MTNMVRTIVPIMLVVLMTAGIAAVQTVERVELAREPDLHHVPALGDRP